MPILNIAITCISVKKTFLSHGIRHLTSTLCPPYPIIILLLPLFISVMKWRQVQNNPFKTDAHNRVGNPPYRHTRQNNSSFEVSCLFVFSEGPGKESLPGCNRGSICHDYSGIGIISGPGYVSNAQHNLPFLNYPKGCEKCRKISERFHCGRTPSHRHPH